MPQTLILTSSKPPRHVIITTLGCPINPIIGFEYGRKCLRKLVQVRNAVRLTQRLFIKTGSLTFCSNQKKNQNIVYHNNISPAIMSNIIVLQPITMRFRPPLKPEVTLLDKNQYPIPITDNRVGRKMDVIQCSKGKF